MARTARASVGGICYHVVNRGNGGATVFRDRNDYRGFLDLMARARARLPMRILAYCLMPNHIHLVLWPLGDGDLSTWMQWLLTAHVRRHHRRYGSAGHVWQGRFKAFPIEQDEHLLTVLKYVERNPPRAGLVGRAEDWAWSSLRARHGGGEAVLLEASPVALPRDWPRYVNETEPPDRLSALRQSVNRGTPWGTSAWTRRTAETLGIEASLRPRGRPRKSPD